MTRPFTKIDLIVCRNMLIYLQPVLQKKIFNTFNYILQQDGYLFLGNSETIIDVEEAFADVDSKQRIYRHKRHGTIPVPANLSHSSKRDFALSASRVAYENKPEVKVSRRNANQELYYLNVISNLVSTMLVVNEMRELVQSFGKYKKIHHLSTWKCIAGYSDNAAEGTVFSRVFCNAAGQKREGGCILS